MSKKKKDEGGLVFSTNRDFSFESEPEEEESLSPKDQDLRVHLEKKHRAGKTATIVSGFVGSDSDMQDLGKFLRNKCGTGGSVKDGEIIIQGDMREKVLKILQDKGYRAKRGGG